MQDGRYKHGHSRAGNQSKEYKAWQHVKQRCNNPNNPAYDRYGGRGIKVAERWANSFEAFLEDMGTAPSSQHSIDRYPNNNGNYEPNNCRWATAEEQSNNRHNNIDVEYKGQTKTLKQWSEELGRSYTAVWQRVFTFGWTIDKALETPEKTKELITYNDKTQTIDQWAKETGIHRNTLRYRISQGWAIEEVFSQNKTVPRSETSGQFLKKYKADKA